MSQFIDDLYNAKLKDLKLIAVGLARNTKNNNSTYFPEEKETLQLRVMGGYMSLAKLTKLVDRINKVLLHFPGMTKIFLDYAHEIVPGLYDPTNTIVETFQWKGNTITRKDSPPMLSEFDRINANKITIAIGDVNVSNNVKYKFNKDVQFIGKDHFAWLHHTILTKWHADFFKQELKYIRNFEYRCPKKYTNIIGIYKSHRIYIASELQRSGHSINGFTSCVPQSNHLDKNKTVAKENIGKRNYFYCDDIDYRFKQLQSTFEISDLSVLDKGNAHHVNKSPLNWFSNSYFYISNETCCSNNWPYNELFITEKTYKPIVHFMPFIVAGSAGTLKHLRDKGYETFPEIFDESYDKEINSHKRMEMIVEQIQKACDDPDLHDKIYAMQDKLIHNRQVFFNE